MSLRQVGLYANQCSVGRVLAVQNEIIIGSHCSVHAVNMLYGSWYIAF